jgi:hypothetical protein
VTRATRAARIAVLAGTLAFHAGCQTLMSLTEMAAPTVLAVGNAILTAAAANYTGSYALQVQALVGTLSQTSTNALQAYLERRRQDRMYAAQAAQTASPVAPPAPGLAPPPDPGQAATPEPGQAPPAGSGGETLVASAQPETPPAEPPPPAQAPSDAGPAIALDVALLRRSGPAAEDVAPLADGDVLHKGDGAGGGDRFRLYFRPNVESYIYVVVVDATGWVQPIFPASFDGTAARVTGGNTTLLPDDSHWFGLDQNAGVYHLYFLASRHPREDLETQLREFAAKERVAPAPTQTRSVEEAVVVEGGWVAERGDTVTHRGVPSEVRTRSGGYEVTPDTYSFGVADADFVLTRHFRAE